MELTIVGCSGSYPGPDSPSSCYVVEHDGFRLLIDLGTGALGALQRHCDPRSIDAIAISHLHPDHCLDMTGLYVLSKYHPDGPYDPIPVYGPDGAAEFFRRANGIDASPMGCQFDFVTWQPDATTKIGPFSVTVVEVVHPIPAFGLRIEAGGKTIAYSGDTAWTPVLEDLARDADLFLCEASFVDSADNPPEIHLTGSEAGKVAAAASVGTLLITHIPAWIERSEVEADLLTTYEGRYRLVEAGDVFTL